MSSHRFGYDDAQRTRRAVTFLLAVVACASLGLPAQARVAQAHETQLSSRAVAPDKLSELQELVRQQQAEGRMARSVEAGIRGPAEGVELRLYQLLSERWARCPVPSPAQSRWPQATFQLERDPYSFVVPVPAAPGVRVLAHADRRMLVVGQDLGTMFIIEISGYAQGTRVMGPLPVAEPCS